MAKAKRITERVAVPFQGAKVNLESGTIDDVLICGHESANGRDYPAEVFRRDFKAYEGRPVNCDHGREPSVDRRFGWFSNVRVGEDGRPRGTLNVLTTHPMAARVLEAADRNPALFGFSHVAMCETRTANGREIVEAIKRVESIDLVAEPATTKGLFESKGADVFTFKKLVEWVAKHPKASTKQALKVKGLVEELGDGMGDTAAMPEEPAAETDPDEAITGGFRSGIMALVEKCLSGDGDPKECLKKIKRMLDAHGDVTDSGGGDSGGSSDSDSSDSGSDDMPKESKKPPTIGELVAEAKAAGLTEPTHSDLELLAEIPTAAGRKKLCESILARTPGEKPTSAGRNPGGGLGKSTASTKTTAESIPTDGKAYAARIRE